MPQESTASTIHQICIKVSEDHKADALASLIRRYNPFLMLVFCCSKERAIELSDWLYGEGFNVDVLHGDMSQTKCRQVMENFRKAKLQILVASDIAARGLDVEGITQVVNYDIPHDPDWYVHRIGRTGRPAAKGRPSRSIRLMRPGGSRIWKRSWTSPWNGRTWPGKQSGGR